MLLKTFIDIMIVAILCVYIVIFICIIFYIPLFYQTFSNLYNRVAVCQLYLSHIRLIWTFRSCEIFQVQSLGQFQRKVALIFGENRIFL